MDLVSGHLINRGFPGGIAVKKPAANAGNADVIPGLGRFVEKEMPTLSSFLTEKSHGQRSLVGYSPQGSKESDMITRLSTHTHLNNMNIT